MFDRRLDVQVFRDPAWLHWTATVALLVDAIAGVSWALPLAAAQCSAMALAAWLKLRSWRAFPVQI